MSLRRLIRWAKDGDAAVNRHPAAPRAPTRNGYARFGAGIHFCGELVAGLELAVALPLLFGPAPGLRLAGASRYRSAFHFHGLEALRVEWA